MAKRKEPKRTGAAEAKVLETPDETIIAFHMQEHSLLRNRVGDQIQAIHALERYALGGIILLFAWLTTNHQHLGKVQIAWLLPPFLCLLAWYRAGALGRKLGRMAEYLQVLEAHLLSKSTHSGGWETFMAKKGPTGEKASRKTFWIASFSLAMLFAITSFVIHEGHHNEEEEGAIYYTGGILKVDVLHLSPSGRLETIRMGNGKPNRRDRGSYEIWGDRLWINILDKNDTELPSSFTIRKRGDYEFLIADNDLKQFQKVDSENPKSLLDDDWDELPFYRRKETP